jgi:dehydrogenase/reductase SDR family protein 7B
MSGGLQTRAPVVWITGASSGIGEAIAISFAERGARLVLSSRRREALELVADACGGAAGRPAVLPLDLTRPDTFTAAVREVVALHGRIDILVNNGGVSQRSRAAETTEAVERAVMEVDYFGTILLTKAVLTQMFAQGSGRVVVISSVLGYVGTPGRAAYAAAKHALHGWFDSLREEVRAAGVRVLIVCPGYVRTNVSLNALSADGTPIGKMESVIERGIPAERCAQAVLDAIDRDREEILVGGKEIWAARAKRWFPRTLSRVMRRLVARGAKF